MDDQADDFAGMPGFEELGLDPDEWLWVRGVDYLSGWRAGREQAERLNAAIAVAGIAREELRAVAATGADGSGRVRLLGTLAGAAALTGILREVSRPRGAA